MLSETGEGEEAIRQLVTFCTVLKKQQTQNASDKKHLREENEKLKRDTVQKKKLLTERTEEMTRSQEQLKHSEEDLKHAEKQIESLQKKLKALSKAIESPSNTTSSFARRLVNESPAPLMMMDSPCISKPTIHGGVVDLDVSGDLFLTPEVTRTKSQQLEKEKRKSAEMADEGTYIKISTAALNNPPKKVKRDPSDISNTVNVPSINSYNLFKKKGPLVPSISRSGFNGMGSTSNFVAPLGPPKPRMLKIKKRHLGPNRSTKIVKDPALPTMDGFLN